MTRVGITGHQGLSAATAEAIRHAVAEEIQRHRSICGVTSLAEGTDQIFAEEVLAHGGSLLAVIPSLDYESSFEEPEALRRYRILMERSNEVIELDFTEPGEEAYWAAGRKVVELSDEILAVWDGKPSGGLGGTADIVAFAEQQEKPLTIIWPEGSSRR